MHTLSVCCLALICVATLTLANPAKTIEKKSISNALAPGAQAEEAKLNEETLLETPGENVERSKKATTTFCVEIKNDQPVQVNCAELCPVHHPIVEPIIHPVPVPVVPEPAPCHPEIGAYLVQQPAEVVYAPTGNCFTHGSQHLIPAKPSLIPGKPSLLPGKPSLIPAKPSLIEVPTVVNVPSLWPAHQHLPLHPAGVECTCKSTPGGVAVQQEIAEAKAPADGSNTQQLFSPDAAARQLFENLHRDVKAQIAAKSAAMKNNLQGSARSASVKTIKTNPEITVVGAKQTVLPNVEIKEASAPATAPTMMPFNAPSQMSMASFPVSVQQPVMMPTHFMPQGAQDAAGQMASARTVQIFPGGSPLMINPTGLSSSGLSLPSLPSLPSLSSLPGLPGLLGFDSRAAMMPVPDMRANYLPMMPSLDQAKQSLYDQYQRQMGMSGPSMIPGFPFPIGVDVPPYMMRNSADGLLDSISTGLPLVQRIGRGQDENDAKEQEKEQKEKAEAAAKSEISPSSDVLDHFIKSLDSAEDPTISRVARFFPNQKDAEVDNLLEDD